MSGIRLTVRDIPAKAHAAMTRLAKVSRRSLNAEVVIAIEERVAVQRNIIRGYVWCDRSGSIHADSLNPFDYDIADHCLPEEHSQVFRMASERAALAKKGRAR